MSEEAVKGRLRAWILERAHQKEAAPVASFDDRTPIIVSGLLSSLEVVELLLYIEELRGEEIDQAELEPEMVESVDSIYTSLFR
jgi:acyl carrier protein